MAKKRSKKEVLQTITSHLCDLTYKERPVSMEEFLSNDEYLGTLTSQGSTVYPVWKKTLDIVSKEDSKYIVVLTGSIGSGKSRVAIWGMAYVMYRLLCMRNPWNYFGKAAGGKMAIVFFNLTKTLSSSKGFNLLQSCLLNSPWFRRHGIIVGSDNLPRIEFPLFEYKLGSPYSQGFGCLSGNTKISLLDGREITIPEIIEEKKHGVQHWTYSYDCKKKNIVSGKILFAQKTRLNAQLVRVHLDNDKYIDATPDHKFMLRDGTYREAQHLQSGDSLMPLYRQSGKGGYTQFFEPNSSGYWLYVHRRMAGPIPKKFRDEKGRFKKSVIVHHKDFNKFNNNPTNLEYMGGKEHQVYHQNHAKETLCSPESQKKSLEARRILMSNPEYAEAINKKNSDGVKKSWTPERRVQQKQRRIEFNKGYLKEYNKRPDVLKKANKKKSEASYKMWNSDKSDSLRKNASVRLVERNKLGQAKRANDASNLPENKIKRMKSRKAWLDSLEGIAWRKRQSSFMILHNPKSKKRNNHKVIYIEYLKKKEDVYDIGIENYHNFAVSSGVFVHNSVGEDVILADLDELDSTSESEKQRLRVLKMYENTVSRFKSRFVNDGESIGRLFLIASKQERMSFLNTFITEMKGSKSVYIIDIPIWEARPKSDYSGEKFYIMLGDVYTPSKILGTKDIEGKYSCPKEELDNVKRDGYGVLEVPIEYYDDFLRDIVLSLRNIAGVSVNYLRKSKLFTSEKLLTDCYDLTKKDPVKKLTIEIGLRDNVDLINFLNLNDIRVPLNVPRFIHQDFGLTGDSLGLAMSCVRGWLKVNVPQQDGTFRVAKLPVAETDFVMRIKAKPDDEIPQHKIRKLILDLKQVYKFNIVLCTFDLRLASADTMQILDNAGIKCEYFSVDKNPQVYLSYAEVVKEGRWVCHRNNYLHFELSNLEKDPVTGKIDHPEKVVDIEFLDDGNTKEIVMLGSKDCADAVAASTMKALQNCQVPPDVEIMKDLMKRATASTELDLTTNYDWVLGTKPKDENPSKDITKKEMDNFKDLFRRSQQG